MKPITKHIRQKIQTFAFLICILSIPFEGLAIEPIATIGHPQPLKQIFLDNETILRVVLQIFKSLM